MATTEIALDERTSEQALVAGAGQGHEAAFDELYRRHAASAWRLGLAVTRNPHDAADVVAESFAKVFTAIRHGRYAVDAPFRPYLLTTTRNAAIDLHRSRARETVTDDDSVLDHGRASVDPVDSLEDGENADLVAQAFGRLPERWRSVLWLTEVEGLKPRDVAPIVGLSANATSQLAVRARKGLREQYLQAHLAETDDRNCARTVQRLGAYVAGSMSAGDRAKIERHLSLCEACTDRHAQVSDVNDRLRAFALPLPMLLIDDVRAAWTAAVAAAAPATGTGLSETTEKVLAGVSAVAAAVGVLGATLFGLDNATSEDRQTAAKPIAPIVTEVAAPSPVGLGAGIDLVTRASTDARLPRSSGVAGGAITTAAQQSPSNTDGRSTDGPAPDGPTSGSPDTIAAEDGNASPVPVPDPADGQTPIDDGSGVTIGTTIADTPIAVEVSDDPGLTVGPISVGSAPEPPEETVETSDSSTETDTTDTTDTDSADAVTEPVTEVVDTAEETVGL